LAWWSVVDSSVRRHWQSNRHQKEEKNSHGEYDEPRIKTLRGDHLKIKKIPAVLPAVGVS
jgi:hypothetical protein